MRTSSIINSTIGEIEKIGAGSDCGLIHIVDNVRVYGNPAKIK